MGRIERNREIERERAVLERIVALLLALAGMAERACALPAPARLRLLAILGFGEEAARDLVVALTPGATADDPASPPAGHADGLAARFRVLALVLATLLASARQLAGVLAHGRRHGLPVPQRGPAGPIVFLRVARSPVRARYVVIPLPGTTWKSIVLGVATRQRASCSRDGTRGPRRGGHRAASAPRWGGTVRTSIDKSLSIDRLRRPSFTLRQLPPFRSLPSTHRVDVSASR